MPPTGMGLGPPGSVQILAQAHGTPIGLDAGARSSWMGTIASSSMVTVSSGGGSFGGSGAVCFGGACRPPESHAANADAQIVNTDTSHLTFVIMPQVWSKWPMQRK
jgi:hypothetical protein